MIKRYVKKEEAKINITPMLDIVFIMLIFFILTTWTEVKTGINTVSYTCPTVRYVKNNNILIEVKAPDDVWVNKQPTVLSEVRAHVEILHAEKPEASAIILTNRDSRTGDLLNVMAQIKTAGVDNISIAADKNSG